MELGRVPPVGVTRELRREVLYGCPVPLANDRSRTCGSPYLVFHHFDPPRRERHHHNLAGMIALCSNHHAMAESYSADQLRAFKRGRAESAGIVRGEISWMRNKLLVLAGGNYFYDVPTILSYRGESKIAMPTNADGYLTLDIGMVSAAKEPRLKMSENFWSLDPNASDLARFDCPPSGKRIRAEYRN